MVSCNVWKEGCTKAYPLAICFHAFLYQVLVKPPPPLASLFFVVVGIIIVALRHRVVRRLVSSLMLRFTILQQPRQLVQRRPVHNVLAV